MFNLFNFFRTKIVFRIKDFFRTKKAFRPKDIGYKLSDEEIAKLLKTNPEALKAFESEYKKAAAIFDDDNLVHQDAHSSSNLIPHQATSDELKELEDKIVDELLAETQIFLYKRRTDMRSIMRWNMAHGLPDKELCVKKNDIEKFELNMRPQCTSLYQKRDIKEESYKSLLYNLKMANDIHVNSKERRVWYNLFRQGLDILDLDPITYEMLSCNKNSMGYWLPNIIFAVECQGFFKIPSTKIMKVPMNMLQLTRSDFNELTRTTLDIVDKVCYKAFELDETKSYFVKTGTHASKFFFRNTLVTGPEEVRELGEYLLFNHCSDLRMAGTLGAPSIYGVSTTNEWVVREYIEDKENNPTIYAGLPLHTEYRVFVDFSAGNVLGIHPYWDPDVMKKRFAEDRDIHDRHDYHIYMAHEETLMNRYNENKDLIVEKIQEFVPYIPLSGQWSIDIMQNGDDFWLIDMAVAENSFFYEETVPKNWRHPMLENWIPKIKEK